MLIRDDNEVEMSVSVKRMSLFAFVATVSLSLAGCPKQSAPTPRPAGDAGAKAKPKPRPSPAELLAGVTLENLKGLYYVLSEGDAEAGARQVAPPAKAEKLGGDALKAVLKRMPPLVTQKGDTKSFAFRKRSMPPPRTGETVKGNFPPPAPKVAPTPKSVGPLEVKRYQPEGKVPLAPHLSVTFNQPMVAITSHDDLAREELPVKLSPEPPGTWRWIGTKTLLFEPKPRFPMATKYTVEIPAGTKSALGGTLAKAQTWTFSTPPPKVTRFWPRYGTHKLDVPMFVHFDQKVDPDTVLSTIKVKGRGKTYDLALMSPAEIQKHETLRGLVGSAKEGRWLAFKATTEFPKDTSIQVSIGPGTPSLEGPLKMQSRRRYNFSTYPPLRVRRHWCRWRTTTNCPPGNNMYIDFSTPLDMESWTDTHVSVGPKLKAMGINTGGTQISVRGITEPRSKYTVTLSPEIKDIYGQTLGDTKPMDFSYGAAGKVLTTNGGRLVVLEPSENPSFSVYTVNHDKVRLAVYKVGPKDYGTWTEYLRQYNNDKKVPHPPGKRVANTTLKTKGDKDQLVETKIALRKFLPKKSGKGHLIVQVEPMKQAKYRWGHIRMHHWVQVTDLALDASVDDTELFAWVSKLKDGAPVGGAKVSVVGGPNLPEQATNDAGVAALKLGDSGKTKGLLVATVGDDTAILPEEPGYWSFNRYGSEWRKRSRGERLRWHVYDDRGMYKPKETVTLKGFVRRYDRGEKGDVKAFNGAAKEISYVVKGPRGNRIAKGKVPLTKLGGFHLSFDLPDNVNLGSARVELSANGGDRSGYTSHRFQIQEFRRPEYEVGATASAGPHIVKGHAEATVTASYYTGGGLPGAEVNWTVNQQVTGYRPPNNRKFQFGVYVPWWQRYYGESTKNTVNTSTFKGVTDAAGKHKLRVDFPAVNPPRATTIRAQAGVIDVNRQQWYATTNILVHPAAHYVGMKTTRSFYQKTKPIKLDLVVTDIDGKRIAGRPIEVKAERLEWRRIKGKYQQVGRDAQTCTKTSAADAVRCEFKTPIGGRYRLTSRIKDTQGRANESQMTLWVSGGKMRPQRGVAMQKVVLVPDKESYQPGDTAEILAQAPFPNAEGMMTVRRSGVVHTERFKFSGSSHTLKLPITEEHLPNVRVHVHIVGDAPRTDDAGEVDPKLPKRPAYGAGSINLPVPPSVRILDVAAKVKDDVVEPRGETTMDVTVKDASGNPVAGAEVAVVVVDEAILALSNYKLADPIASFYTSRGGGARDHHSRSLVLLDDPTSLANKLRNAARNQARKLRPRKNGRKGRRYKKKSARGDFAVGSASGAGRGFGGLAKAEAKPAAAAPAPMEEAAADADGFADDSGGGGGEGGSSPIAMRKDFNPLAVFMPNVPTDANGKAVVAIKTKDNLTRYRIMVVAADSGNKFGTVESAITARLPIMVRPSAPRFLNFGDRFELPVVVQNQTNKALMVDVAARASNAKFTDGSGRRVRVPANDRVEVRIPATTREPGTARFQVGATSGRFADAAEVSLPVWTPATTEAFATYGEVDKKGSISQPVKLPSEVVKEFGGLEITTSSTALHALTDALIYLVRYRYECSEQLSSRIMGVAALRDVLTAFKSPQLPKKSAMEATVRKDLKILKSRQNWTGGFGFWKPGQRAWPYVTTYVTHAITKAKEKGYKLPSGMLKKALRYLKRIERYYPWYYGPDIRRTISSYALYVRNMNGDKDAAKARGIIKEAGGVKGLRLEAIGWLYPVVTGDKDSTAELAEIKRNLNNRVTETAATAHFAASYSDGAHLIMHSSRRADGIILDGLMAEDPKSDLIPKIVRGLLAHRKRGRWLNTQENSFILLALDRYFNTYEKVTPDFVARVWLGDKYAGEHAFKGRTTERHQIDIPMPWVAKDGGKHNLILQKDGQGRMYYRLGMRYAPSSLRLDAADHGFAVRREYEGVDDPKDVVRHKGTWYMRAGSKVRVTLTMVAPTRRYHVALVDQLPAGLEPMNPALAVTGDIPQPKKKKKSRFWWWGRSWFEHQNMRDERVEAFTSLLWGGVHTYTYVATATTPGRFVTPPAKAEEMYFPETFGRSSSDIVRVVDSIPADAR